MSTQKKIRFCTKEHEYFQFSNFYKSPFMLNGQIYTHMEIYFQSQKFTNDPEYYEIIRNADSPMKAKMLGTQNKICGYPKAARTWVVNKANNFNLVYDVIDEHRHVPKRSDWEDVQNYIMKIGLHAKFSQNPKLSKLLLETGDAILEFYIPGDTYWGCYHDNDGLNMMGKLLMEVRDEIREQM